MSRRTYRAVEIKSVDVNRVSEMVSERAIVGLDVAKTKQFAAVADARGETKLIVKWVHPLETPAFIEVLEGLRAKGLEVEVVMEPSGT